MHSIESLLLYDVRYRYDNVSASSSLLGWDWYLELSLLHRCRWDGIGIWNCLCYITIAGMGLVSGTVSATSLSLGLATRNVSATPPPGLVTCDRSICHFTIVILATALYVKAVVVDECSVCWCACVTSGGVCSLCWMRVAFFGEGSSSLVRTASVDRDVLAATTLDVGFCSSNYVSAPVRRYQGLKQLNQRALLKTCTPKNSTNNKNS